MQKASCGEIVAQARDASRLPRIAAKQDYLAGFYSGYLRVEEKKCQNHRIT
jgi:hypothetical protein